MQQDIEITAGPVEADASCCGGACGCGAGAADETHGAAATVSATDAAQSFEVEGMTCGHCARAVSSELEGLEGVRDVRIDVVAGGRSIVTVDADAPLDRERVRAAVDEAGYTLVG